MSTAKINMYVYITYFEKFKKYAIYLQLNVSISIVSTTRRRRSTERSEEARLWRLSRLPVVVWLDKMKSSCQLRLFFISVNFSTSGSTKPPEDCDAFSTHGSRFFSPASATVEGWMLACWISKNIYDGKYWMISIKIKLVVSFSVSSTHILLFYILN